MPRRRPGALRAEQRGSRAPEGPPPVRIHGISARTGLAIDRVERLSGAPDVYPGATDHALRRYRAFLEPPGRRPLYPQDAECSCRGHSFDDVRHARDVLDDVLRQLPVRARAELQRRVARLDEVYRARTLPDPFSDSRQWRPEVWWRRRLAGGGEGG
ncbi:hypothetical protein [Streptomyces acidiscabies]|uniref:Uncharacterized protein n=1 Tax=Streptomyces acidiscabies TaxID=42234 RepID=A0AAP6BHT8_9ACTN|nr:hypothetical protein [Streptomyces acidiscabies]MBZ3910341.1 hypothetical protein [Streptomyces acidiscabies]MDX2964977.1 hypothetical protein [Streptomyces acidiscabies]MDX3024658.1 hypothetical protein [Streptomyces acidiscabies]MDX3796703.1 hypothetical protein [Streptomyces acidiscabies]GAQ59028.1 hypothetical protein a10_08928 [Streptomyces acidiscabies]